MGVGLEVNGRWLEGEEDLCSPVIYCLQTLLIASCLSGGTWCPVSHLSVMGPGALSSDVVSCFTFSELFASLYLLGLMFGSLSAVSC